MMSKTKALLGLGAACAACCAAAPLLAALGLTGLGAGVLGGWPIELTVLALGAVMAGGYLLLRRRKRSCAADSSCGCKPAGGTAS